MRLLVGTYTRGTAAKGIYQSDFDAASGLLGDVRLFVGGDNPSFLARKDDLLFACSEVGDADDGGEIVVFSISPEKVILRQALSSHGADPCHLAVSDTRFAVANYTGRTFALFEFAQGRIGKLIVNPSHTRTGPHSRQSQAHPHGVYFCNDELWVTDLGGDLIARYAAGNGDFRGDIIVAPGSGPRHLTATGRYLVNELSNTVDELVDGAVCATVSTLPDGWRHDSIAAEIVQYDETLYVSNRGHDSIAVLGTTPSLRLLQTQPSGGRHPRHCVVDPTGKWLIVANKDTGNIVVMPVLDDGRLGDTVSAVNCPSPTCLLFA